MVNVLFIIIHLLITSNIIFIWDELCSIIFYKDNTVYCYAICFLTRLNQYYSFYIFIDWT